MSAKKVKSQTAAETKMSLLLKRYREQLPALKQRMGYKHDLEVPRLVKVVVNICLSEAVKDPKILDKAEADLKAITGQKPVRTLAKKSIANFKLRQGVPLGVMVTLRKKRMYEFLDRLINVALPRVRDFRGLSEKAFDLSGNYTLGLREQIIFPEIKYESIDKIRGLNIAIVSTAKTREEGVELLSLLGFPFRK